jgi:hypothetical protein
MDERHADEAFPAAIGRAIEKDDTKAAPSTVAKAAWDIKEWAEAVGLSRATVYQLIGSEALPTAKIFARRLILVSPEAFLAAAAKMPLTRQRPAPPPARGRPRKYPSIGISKLGG